MQHYMLSQFSVKLFELGLDIEVSKDKIKLFTTSLTLQDFDNNYLRIDKFIKFCEFLEVSHLQLCDEYYRFILSSYGKDLVKFRQENHLSQKQCAKFLKISPTDIGLFEKGLKYPTRNQYLKLKGELK